MRKITLAQLRAQNQLTQVEAAKKAKITTQTWNNVEKGLRKPQTITLAKIAKAFDLKPESIAVGDEKPEENANDTTNSDDGIRQDLLIKFATSQFLIATKKLPLIKNTINNLYSEQSKQQFVADVATKKPAWNHSDNNVIWVNMETGAVASDETFKKVRIEAGLNTYNYNYMSNNSGKSAYDIVNEFMENTGDWNRVEVQKQNSVQPLALLHVVIEGPNKFLDPAIRKEIIKDSIEHAKVGTTPFDLDENNFYCDKWDNNSEHVEITDDSKILTDKKFRMDVINDVVNSRNEDFLNGYSYYDFQQSTYDDLFEAWIDYAHDYRTFAQLQEHQLKERHDEWSNPFSLNTDNYYAYEKWLDNQTKDDSYELAGRLASQLNENQIDLDAVYVYYTHDKLNLEDVDRVFTNLIEPLQKAWLNGRIEIDNAKAEELLKKGYKDCWWFENFLKAPYAGIQYENDKNKTIDIVELGMQPLFYLHELAKQCGGASLNGGGIND